MAKIGTKKIGGDVISKTLLPGNHTCTIIGVKLDPSKFKANAYNLVLTLKGPKLSDFEGFLVDKDDSTKGYYDGQIGYVRATEWAFADGTTKSGTPIEMEDEILKFIKKMCVEIEALEWFEAQDNVHDSIELFVDAFVKDHPYEGKELNFCIAGREYVSKKGYTNFDLYLPKFTRMDIPFEKVGAKPSRLITFDNELHIKKATIKEVTDFGDPDPSSDLNIPENNDDFKV